MTFYSVSSLSFIKRRIWIYLLGFRIEWQMDTLSPTSMRFSGSYHSSVSFIAIGDINSITLKYDSSRNYWYLHMLHILEKSFYIWALFVSTTVDGAHRPVYKQWFRTMPYTVCWAYQLAHAIKYVFITWNLLKKEKHYLNVHPDQINPIHNDKTDLCAHVWLRNYVAIV